jgi:glycogen phosphorylase
MFRTKIITTSERKIAYFSMEIGLTAEMATYSGGLGVLAGDTLKSQADLHVPSVAVTLLNENGYFLQELDENGTQIEKPSPWDKSMLKKLDAQITVQLEERIVLVQAWQYDIIGERGFIVPVIYLDTNVTGNSDYDKTLTNTLYGGDRYYRFCQEMILGIGGVRMLEALGYMNIEKYHMNEGHAALATIELLHRFAMDKEVVKEKCVFTTHTPVEAGHDTFEIDMVGRVIKDYYPWSSKLAEHDGKFNMTYLALNLSNYVNGVAKKHKEVSMMMFPGREIHSITNGIHTRSFVCESMAKVFSTHIPDWGHDPMALRAALSIPNLEIMQAHQERKRELLSFIKLKTKVDFDENVLTIGFARRATAYKRADLIFSDINWLNAIADRAGKIQLVFAGKAHKHDGIGKDIIKKIWATKDQLSPNIKLVFLENYDMKLAKLMTSGVDVWLNTPLRPLEASGTSGMKAAVNGVPQFSVLDGWWIEGHIEGETGWSIGPRHVAGNQDNSTEDARDLYVKLEQEILPIYYRDTDRWIMIMKHAIALNGSFFNTHRMVQQYVTNAYFK